MYVKVLCVPMPGMCLLILSSTYTYFNLLKKKAVVNIVEKGEIAQNEQFHFFHFFYAIFIL